MLSQTRLKELLRYDPETGEFFWRIRLPPHGGKIYPGKLAGSVTTGRCNILIGGKLYKAHRLAWLYVYGKFPIGQLEHRNRNQLDNRIINLRKATYSQNGANSKVRKNSTSGLKGVYWSKKQKVWYSIIQHNKKQIYLGLFHTPEAAHTAYCEAAKRLHGEFFNPG